MPTRQRDKSKGRHCRDQTLRPLPNLLSHDKIDAISIETGMGFYLDCLIVFLPFYVLSLYDVLD